MPIRKGNFKRVWRFVDQFQVGQDITRLDIDVALEDIADAIRELLSMSLVNPDLSAAQSDIRHVYDFDPARDGETDDVAKFQAAIDSRPNTDAPHVIRVPEGQYAGNFAVLEYGNRTVFWLHEGLVEFVDTPPYGERSEILSTSLKQKLETLDTELFNEALEASGQAIAAAARLATLFFQTVEEFTDPETDTTAVEYGTIAVIGQDPQRPHVKVMGATAGDASGSIKDDWEPMVFSTPAQMLASRQPPRDNGAIWSAGRWLFKQQAADPDGKFLTTNGGAILEALSTDDGMLSMSQFDYANAADRNDRLLRAFKTANGRILEFPSATYALPIPDGYDVYLVAGDDWAAGNNAGPIINPGADSPTARALMYSYDDGTIKLATETLENPGTATGVGPGLAFAKRMLAGIPPNNQFAYPANRGIILVPACGVYVGGFTDWMQGGAAYNAAVTGINAALAYGGGTNRFMGGLFAGGFSDVGAATTKANAKARLTSLVQGLQAAYNPQARFVFARFITEFAVTGATIDSALAEMFELPYVTIIQGLTGVQEASQRTTAAGSRTLGTNFATAFQKSGPADAPTRFLTIPGENNRALVRDGATFSPSRPLGVEWTYENSNSPTTYGVRGYRNLRERADFISARNSGGQWPGFVLPYTEHGFSAQFKLVRPADGPTSWPNSPMTTLQAIVIGDPEGNGNIGANAALALVLGKQNTWGFIAVVGNSPDLVHPDGKPAFATCAEFDMQFAKGTGASSGAGILINNFDDPADFAGCSIVGDGGGAWQDGIFFGNVRRYGIYFGATFQGTHGLWMRETDCSVAALGLNDGATNGIKWFNGAQLANLYQHSGGALRVDSAGGTVLTSADAEGSEVLAISQSDGTQSVRMHVATGPIANAAAAAMRMRANSVNSRSLNAGGTLNASGADYAEYEIKRGDCGTIAKGDVIGFDSEGYLTDRFDLAISFGIKSTAPNLVGGDDWADALDPRPELPEYEKPDWAKSFELGDRPSGNSRMAEDSDLPERQAEYDAAKEQWEIDKVADRAWFEQSDAYLAALAAQAEWDADLEALRQMVDRVAYCGKCPCNVIGATAGQWLVPEDDGSNGITVALVNHDDLTFAQSKNAIGRVRKILPDGRAQVAVGVRA